MKNALETAFGAGSEAEYLDTQFKAPEADWKGDGEKTPEEAKGEALAQLRKECPEIEELVRFSKELPLLVAYDNTLVKVENYIANSPDLKKGIWGVEVHTTAGGSRAVRVHSSRLNKLVESKERYESELRTLERTKETLEQNNTGFFKRKSQELKDVNLEIEAVGQNIESENKAIPQVEKVVADLEKQLNSITPRPSIAMFAERFADGTRPEEFMNSVGLEIMKMHTLAEKYQNYEELVGRYQELTGK